MPSRSAFLQNAGMFDWDDLRFVLAVARTGSALRAARALSVNQTTVTRRIAQIEDAIGGMLFETKQSGQVVTPLGQMVAAGAERIEAEVLALRSAIEARQRVLSGSVRFTSSEVYANYVVAPYLRSFRQQYPGVRVELITDDRRLDVARGEADVALRAGSRPEGGGIVAQRLPDAGWTAYCSRSYAEEHGIPADADAFAGHFVALVEGPMARLAPFIWLSQVSQKRHGQYAQQQSDERAVRRTRRSRNLDAALLRRRHRDRSRTLPGADPGAGR